MTISWESSTVLKVSGLSKSFGHFHALADVGFELRAGEILGLIGPNGAGKTTLFECLAGIVPADAGTVHVAGRPIEPSERQSLLFYLPDGIAPWSAQSVHWVLDFTIGFFSIHQISDAARVCDRFVLLSSGRVCGEGTLEEVSALAATRGTQSANLEEVFLALT